MDLEKITWQGLVFGRLPCCNKYLNHEQMNSLVFAKKMQETMKGE